MISQSGLRAVGKMWLWIAGIGICGTAIAFGLTWCDHSQNWRWVPLALAILLVVLIISIPVYNEYADE